MPGAGFAKIGAFRPGDSSEREGSGQLRHRRRMCLCVPEDFTRTTSLTCRLFTFDFRIDASPAILAGLCTMRNHRVGDGVSRKFALAWLAGHQAQDSTPAPLVRESVWSDMDSHHVGVLRAGGLLAGRAAWRPATGPRAPGSVPSNPGWPAMSAERIGHRQGGPIVSASGLAHRIHSACVDRTRGGVLEGNTAAAENLRCQVFECGRPIQRTPVRAQGCGGSLTCRSQQTGAIRRTSVWWRTAG